MAKKEMIKLAEQLIKLEKIIDTGTKEEADQARLDTETLITKIVKTYGFKGMFEIDEYNLYKAFLLWSCNTYPLIKYLA